MFIETAKYIFGFVSL